MPPFAAVIRGLVHTTSGLDRFNRMFLHTDLDNSDDGIYVISRSDASTGVESISVAAREASCPARIDGTDLQPRLPHMQGYLSADGESAGVVPGSHVVAEISVGEATEPVNVELTQVPYVAASPGTLVQLRLPSETAFDGGAGVQWIRDVGSWLNHSAIEAGECSSASPRLQTSACVEKGGTGF